MEAALVNGKYTIQCEPHSGSRPRRSPGHLAPSTTGTTTAPPRALAAAACVGGQTGATGALRIESGFGNTVRPPAGRAWGATVWAKASCLSRSVTPAATYPGELCVAHLS